MSLVQKYGRMAVALAISTFLAFANAKKYNILSLDAAKYGGICTSKFVGYMEKRAYYLAREEAKNGKAYCYPENDERSIPMNELFDMVAGSETGAIIAATIAQPKAKGSKESKHLAQVATDFFEKNVDVMYIDTYLGEGYQVLIYILGILFFGAITYVAAFYYFRDDRVNLRIVQLKKLMKLNKHFVKGKIIDTQAIDNQQMDIDKSMKEITEGIDVKKGKESGELLQIYRDMNHVRSKCNSQQNQKDTASLEKLIQIESTLEQVNQRYQKRQAYPWYLLFCTCVLVAIILQFGFIPAMEYTAVQIEDYQILEDDLKTFITAEKFEDQVFDNFLVVSWELKKRQPFVLTKQSVKDDEAYKGFDDILKSTLISAVNPVYFKPYVEGEKIFIGGDAVAVSPALLAFMAATEEGGKNPEDIEVFSIGSLNARADKIPENIGAIEWLSRVDSLTGQSKKHTQDYLLHQILESYGTSLKKYSYPMSYEGSKELAEMSQRLDKLQHLCGDFINERQHDLVIDLKELLKERFVGKHKC